MPLRHLKVVEGGSENDLVTTIIRALDLARSRRSTTSADLLEMALLNEGIRLAADLARKQRKQTSLPAPAIRKESPSSPRLNLVGAERSTGP
jgi:hypothetical protein